MLTQERLQQVLDYDPETGVFVWKRRPNSKNFDERYAGRIAGGRNGHGYLAIEIDARAYRAHRLAWFYVYGEWPEDEIDHINRNGEDNRLANLRLATQFDNLANKNIYKNNKSGFRGVTWSKSAGKWRVIIIRDRKREHLGYFHNKEEGYEVYKAAAQQRFGEFCPDYLSDT